MIRESVLYEHQGIALEGVLFKPDNQNPPAPGVLLIHEYTGIGEYLLRHVERLIERGFTVLVHDMYGIENLSANTDEASQISRIFRDNRQLMRDRARVGFNCLKQQSGVDPKRLFTMGFSFGGCAALELARSGANLAGAISVYGYLDTANPEDARNIICRTLVIHGAKDPVVSNHQLLEFIEEMSAAQVDCQIKIFSDAGHGFCNTSLKPIADCRNCFSAKHDRRAWGEIELFLTSVHP